MPSQPAASSQKAPLGRAGRLFELNSGGRLAVVTEQGASLYRLNWEGVELLDSAYDDGFAGSGAYGQLLVPWPGRVSGGVYTFEGEEHRLAVDDHVTSSAIHGLVRWSTWAPRRHDGSSLTMGLLMLAQPGYPFCFDLEQTYSWSPEALVVSFSATNVGAKAAPFGYGCHPYFTVGLPRVNDGVLQVGAASYLESDELLRPLPPAKPVEGTLYDFRSPRPVGGTRLDVTFTDLQRGPDGAALASFASADGAVSVTCRYGPAISYVQVYSGDTLAAERRRRGLAIEPYTCAPDSFNNGLGLWRVAPGETVHVEWSISATLR